ncbi:MAG: glycosyltransferase [Anaerolineae bacterium]
MSSFLSGAPAVSAPAPGRPPRVSVVIPTYNRADLVGEAMQSVLCQTFSDLELVVVDDGSTDDTPGVLARIADPRIRVISQANQGISGALNAGMRAARGEYVIMLGSDDRFLPQCLARLTAAAARQPNAVVVYGRARGIDLAGGPLTLVTGAPLPYPDRPLLSALYGDFVATIAALIRRDTLDRVGYCDPNLKGNEDWDLWIRLARVGKFVFVPEVLAEFRIHPGRFTAAQHDKLAALLAGRLAILDKAFAAPDLPSDVVAARPAIYRNAYIDIGLRWLNVGEYGDAGAAFRQALRYGRPLPTAGRIVSLAVFYRFARRYGWANRLSDSAARWKRARRASHAREGMEARLFASASSGARED